MNPHNPDYRELPPPYEQKIERKACGAFRPQLPVEAGDSCIPCANCGHAKWAHSTFAQRNERK